MENSASWCSFPSKIDQMTEVSHEQKGQQWRWNTYRAQMGWHLQRKLWHKAKQEEEGQPWKCLHRAESCFAPAPLLISVKAIKIINFVSLYAAPLTGLALALCWTGYKFYSCNYSRFWHGHLSCFLNHFLVNLQGKNYRYDFFISLWLLSFET